MSRGLHEVVQARTLQSSMATSQRSALWSRSLVEVYGLAALGDLTNYPKGSGSNQQLTPISMWSVSTPPSWWGNSLDQAVDKKALSTPSALVATHEDISWLPLVEADLELDYIEFGILFDTHPGALQDLAEQKRADEVQAQEREKKLADAACRIISILASKKFAVAHAAYQRNEAAGVLRQEGAHLAQENVQLRRGLCKSQLQRMAAEQDLQYVCLALIATRLRVQELQNASNIMIQALTEKDTALAMQRGEADVQISMWEQKSMAAHATADDAQGKAVEWERQMQDAKTEADQLRLSCAQQAADIRILKEEVRQAQLHTSQLDTELHKQRMQASASQQAKQGPPEVAAAESGAVEQGRAGLIMAYDPDSPLMSEDEGAGAPAGADDDEPAAEVVSPRGSEGGASSSLAASLSDSPTLQAGSSELTARLQSAQHAERVASAAGASSSGRFAQPGIKLPSNFAPCSNMCDDVEARGRAPAGPDDSEPAGTLETVQSESAEGWASSSTVASPVTSSLPTMCDDEESRAKAPAGADNDQPAVTTEVLSARASEGGASSSLAASPPNSPTFEMSDEEEARGRAPAGPDDSEPAGTPETVQSKSAEGLVSGSTVASPFTSSLLMAGSSELTARLQSAQYAERVASAAGASSSGRPAQPGIKLPSNFVPCSKAPLHFFLGLPGCRQRDADGINGEVAAVSHDFPMTSSKLASAEMEKKLRKKKHIPLDKEVEWRWFSPAYSPRVRMLEWKGDSDIGLLGRGSTARVKYGEMLLDDGSIRPCAFKGVPYTGWYHKELAHCELTALQAALGLPNLVQCVGAFEICDPDGLETLNIVTEYVPGEDLDKAFVNLQLLLDKDEDCPESEDDDYPEKVWEAGKYILEQTLKALQPLHAQGRGHCDIKMQNIRVELGDDGSILSCIVVDLGASAVFQGPFDEQPLNFTYSRVFACPEIARAEAAGRKSQEVISAVAQDMWGLGYLLLILLADCTYFSKTNSSPGQEWHDLVCLHSDWAVAHAALSLPAASQDSVEGDGAEVKHPILECVSEAIIDGEEHMVLYLLRVMLEPKVDQRATVQQVLGSEFFQVSED